jgi:hypothetical protein
MQVVLLLSKRNPFSYAALLVASARRAARRRLLRLCRASGVPRHVVRLVTRLVASLVVDYFAYIARPGASARRVACHPARRRLLHLHRASGCFGTSHGLSRDSLSTTSPRAGSSSTTSPTLRVRVPRHVARLVTQLVVDYFDYTARPGASTRRTAPRVARRRLLCLCRVSGCLGTSRGSSRGSSHGSSHGSSRCSSSTTLPTSRVRVPRHDARLITRLVVDYSTYAARPVASARRAACRVTHCRLLRLAQARRRLLRLRRAYGCLGTSRGSSRSSSSTTSTTPRVRVPRHVARLIIDYFASAARPGASARHVARRRLLRLRRASRCLGISRGSSRGSSRRSSSTTSPMPRVRVPRHVARLVVN